MKLITRIKDWIFIKTNGRIRFRGQISAKELTEIYNKVIKQLREENERRT